MILKTHHFSKSRQMNDGHFPDGNQGNGFPLLGDDGWNLLDFSELPFCSVQAFDVQYDK